MQLNFSRFRRGIKGYKKTTPNIQVVGFTDEDSHSDVLEKAARGLGLKCDLDQLSLLCSGGMVIDSPLGNNSWSLGEYIKQHGGTQNRSKKVWGICIPCGLEESDMTTSDSVRTNVNSCFS